MMKAKKFKMIFSLLLYISVAFKRLEVGSTLTQDYLNFKEYIAIEYETIICSQPIKLISIQLIKQLIYGHNHPFPPVLFSVY